jgi:tape measure domain-containing protein
MSTLDKLKQKLNFGGATKGFADIDGAAKKVNMSGLGTAVDTVSTKFSALQVMGVTALANITNSAVNAGKRIVSALTIDPIKTGFSEYETKINSIQTIMSNTASKGTTMADVTRVIDELNTYADKTIYNFAEMTRNIGTFTAAGVGLEESAAAIQGIANLAAASGSTSQQASTAMYQLSQALAAGTVKLMDWNSVVNAGMGGEKFQEALKATARDHGVAVDALIEKNGSFRESLSEGWISAEILNETLNKFTTKGAKEYGDAMVKSGKWTQAQADALMEEAKSMEDAATKVKTFTQLWDTMKESVQSGWGKTWELIFGDFEQARELFSGMSDFFGGIIESVSDWRNGILESALGRTLEQAFGGINDAITAILKPVEKVTEAFEGVVEVASDLGSVVDEVLAGKFGNGQERFDALTKAGYNYCEVQNKINEKLGNSHRYTKEQIETQNELIGKQAETTDSTEEQAEAFTKLTDEQKKTLKKLGKMNEAQLKAAGYTDAQIAALNGLKKTAEDLGIPFEEFIDNLDQINGRWLLMNGFKNIGMGLVEVGRAMGDAWKEVFPEHTIENFSNKLFDLIAGFSKLTSSMKGLFYKKVGEKGLADGTTEDIYKLTEAGEKLVRTFKGVFAILDIVGTVVGGALKFGFQVLVGLLGSFDLNLLDITAGIGDAIVKFRDWLDSILSVSKAVEFLVPLIKDGAKKFSEWSAVFKETESVQRLVTAIESIYDAFNKLMNGELDISSFANNLGTNLAEAVKSLPDIAMQIGKDFIAGFTDGLNSSVSGIIGDIVSFCLEFVSAFADALGVESPSWKAFEIVSDFFQGAINGAKAMISVVLKVFKSIGEGIVKTFRSFWDFITDESGNIEWGKIFAGGIIVAMTWLLAKIASAVSGIADALGGFGKLLDHAGDVLKSFSKVLNGIAWDMKAQALQKMAIAIAILVGSLWVLTQIDDIGKLWNAVGVIAALSVILIGLSVALDKMSQASVKIGKGGASIDGLKTGLIQIGAVLLLLAATVKIIGDMKPEEAKQGFKGLAGLAVGLLVFLAIMGGISRYTGDVTKIGGMMIKISVAMLLLVGVIKLINGLSSEEMGKGVLFAAAFTIFVRSLVGVAKDSGANISKVGSMILKLTVAMGLMVGVVKLISTLSAEEMLQGAAFAAGFVAFVWALVGVTKIGKGQEIAKVSGLIMSISVSLMLLVGVCKLINHLSYGDIIKGAAFVTGFMFMLKGLLKILTVGNEGEIAKVTGTILAISVAIGILAAVAMALSFIDLGGLAKGVAAVTVLGLVMTGMIKALKGAKEVKGSIMMMSIAIGVMAAAVVALSMIDDTSKLAAAVGSIALLMGMFALIEKCSGSIGKCMGTLIVMTAIVAALAGILYLLTTNLSDADAAMTIAESLSLLLISLAGVTAILSALGLGVPAALGGLGAFAVVVVGIGALIAAIGALSQSNTDLKSFLDSGIPILEQIGVGIGKFVGGLIGGIGEGLMDSLLKMVAKFHMAMTMLVVASNIGANINLDGFTGVERLLEVLGEIGSTTVGSTFKDWFTAGGTSMEKFQKDGVAFFKAMKAIAEESSGVAVDEAAMSTVISVAQKLADLQSSLEPIGGVVSWFTGRDDLGKFGKNIGKFISSMVTAFSNLDGVTMDTYVFTWIVEAAKKLAELQSSLEPIGGVVSWFKGRDDLGKFGKNIGTFVSSMTTAFGNLDSSTVNEAAVDTIINVSTKLADLQSSLEPIGGVTSWFAGRDDLGKFGKNIGVFISSMVTAFSSLEGLTLDTYTFTWIIQAAQKLADLQSSLEPMGGVISWFTGRDDLGKFGKNISKFISSMTTALATLEGATLDEAALTSVITAATKLAELQSQLEPMGGVISWFTGRDDLGKFGKNVKTFAEAMGKLNEGMGENGITEAAITSISNAGTAILELEKTLPEEHWFDGKMDLSEFSGYITDFSKAMGKFGEAASGIDTAAVSTTISTANKIKTLIESLVGLDTSGLTIFTGIGTGGAAYKIAKAMSAYGNEVAGIDTAAVSTSVSAATKLKNLIANLVGLDASGVENFKPESIGKSLKGYYNKIDSIDSAIINSSIIAAVRLKTLISGMTDLDASGVANFKVKPIGASLKDYSDLISGFDADAVSSSISVATRLRNFIVSLAGINTAGVGSFISAVNQLGTISIANVVKAFSGASGKMIAAGSELFESVTKGMKSKQGALTKTVTTTVDTMLKTVRSKTNAFLKAGTDLANALNKGIGAAKNRITSTIKGVVSASASAVRDKYTSFYNTGTYLVDGFGRGIRDRAWYAENMARDMARRALEAARRELQVNSPSKVFRRLGYSVPEGFSQGIDRMGGMVKRSAVDMAGVALDNVKSSVARIASAISTDIDAQPTIRPVLDLSDVRSGAGAIGGMFGGASVGVMANVGAISYGMSRYGQNGTNNDVINAIDKLNKKLDNIGNTTYSINGVTYDDGSNIRDAVSAIVRQARIERRV